MLEFYQKVRKHSEFLCSNLIIEDYGVQPSLEVSPPKWHLAHTTWFFETFILKPYFRGYQEFHPDFAYLFNSYYQSLGDRNPRTNRAILSRPSVEEVYQYRKHIDLNMVQFLNRVSEKDLEELLILGLNHEQQHQELLITDIKSILSLNLNPPAVLEIGENKSFPSNQNWISIPSGIYSIGHQGKNFHWDNELGVHQQYLEKFEIQDRLVNNAEFLEFIEDGGYQDFNYWHDEAWTWLKENQIEYPLYWYKKEGHWMHYALHGLEKINPMSPVTHISYYEAYAFAMWKGFRLPTEFEWEIASNHFNWGERWEWTQSAYLPYPGFTKAPGALGEYNGKFMVNQMVLRGSSIATPAGHSRKTYRNFFPASTRWQFSGIRLAQ